MARVLKVDKATVSRALSSNSFSPALRPRVSMLIGSPSHDSAAELLHKSLHILKLSDSLRHDAEAMIAKALDLANQNQ